jgi:hypothetical protein
MTTLIAQPSFEIIEAAQALGGKAIKCLLCQRTSYNPNDVENRYCGFCHIFHFDLQIFKNFIYQHISKNPAEMIRLMLNHPQLGRALRQSIGAEPDAPVDEESFASFKAYLEEPNLMYGLLNS